MYFFFHVVCLNNISEQIKRPSECEPLLADAPAEVGFPVLPPMVHDGTCLCDLRQRLDGDHSEDYIKFDDNNNNNLVIVFSQVVEPAWHLFRHVHGHAERAEGYSENPRRGAHGESCRCLQFTRLIGAEGAV